MARQVGQCVTTMSHGLWTPYCLFTEAYIAEAGRVCVQGRRKEGMIKGLLTRHIDWCVKNLAQGACTMTITVHGHENVRSGIVSVVT
jgi:hypothetical protein